MYETKLEASMLVTDVGDKNYFSQKLKFWTSISREQYLFFIKCSQDVGCRIRMQDKGVGLECMKQSSGTDVGDGCWRQELYVPRLSARFNQGVTEKST